MGIGSGLGFLGDVLEEERKGLCGPRYGHRLSRISLRARFSTEVKTAGNYVAFLGRPQFNLVKP